MDLVHSLRWQRARVISSTFLKAVNVSYFNLLFLGLKVSQSLNNSLYVVITIFLSVLLFFLWIILNVSKHSLILNNNNGFHDENLLHEYKAFLSYLSPIIPFCPPSIPTTSFFWTILPSIFMSLKIWSLSFIRVAYRDMGKGLFLRAC